MSIRPMLLNISNNQEIVITKDKFSVGRSMLADYVLNSLAVSRVHFYIEKMDGFWSVRDNSTNGTLVNDILLKSTNRILYSGDIIKIRGGSVSMKFTADPVSSPFVVSSVNGDNLPSVNNDHSYERRGTVEQEPSYSGVFVVTPLIPSSTPDAACSDTPNTSSACSLKRERTPELEESPKKLKWNDEANNPTEAFREELECSVCQELFIKAVTLNCSHTFCTACIYRWKSQRNYCPICRETIKNISPSIVLDNIIEKLVLVMDEKKRVQRNKTVSERLEDKSIPIPKSHAPSESSESEYDDYDEEDDDEYLEEWTNHRYILLREHFFRYY